MSKILLRDEIALWMRRKGYFRDHDVFEAFKDRATAAVSKTLRHLRAEGVIERAPSQGNGDPDRPYRYVAKAKRKPT